ncbi:MAG: 50S ribosomal protein L11 methyltransferase [Clostridia bacterium]
MNWIETKIYTTAEGIDPVVGNLLNLGITGFVIEDSKDFEDFLSDTEIYWDYVEDDLMKLKESETNITVYLPENSQGFEMLNQLKQEMQTLKKTSADFGRLSVECVNVNEEDWENNWKQYFKPFEVGEKLVIKPSWEDYDNKTNRIILEIDPSSSFGTGSHETTKLCLEILEDYVKKDDEILDMGTGSGILSVASMLFGAKKITALDIDENSIKIARENLEKNNLQNFTLHCGNVLEDNSLLEKITGKYDVVVANIVADVIIGMKEILYNSVADDGFLVTSGIISERYKEVQDKLEEQGFKLVKFFEKNDWVALVMKK